MTNTRKTLNRTAVVTQLNAALAGDGLTADQRLTLATFTGGLLLTANAYKGFTYLATEFTEDNTLRTGYDESRRRYF